MHSLSLCVSGYAWRVFGFVGLAGLRLWWFAGWSALRVWRAKSLSESFDTQRLPVSDMGKIKESVDDRYALCLDMLFRVCGARK